jgi:uncharacterized protein YkwD
MRLAIDWWKERQPKMLAAGLTLAGLALILGATAFLLGGGWQRSGDGASAAASQLQPTATARPPVPTSTLVPTATVFNWADAASNWAVIAQMLALTPTAVPPSPPASQPSAPEAPAPSQGSRPVAMPTSTPVPRQPPTPPPPAGCPTASMGGVGLQLFNDINAQRTANGLSALAADGCVAYVALERSNDMATRNYFSHTSPDGTGAFDLLTANGVPYGWAGENLARNNYPNDQTVDVAIRDLMASQGHRDNILSTNYTAMGVAAVNDGTGMWYYTMVFIGPP